MNSETLLADLRRRGFSLSPNGDRLVVAPSSKLTDADRAAIRGFKGELLARLLAEVTGTKTPAESIVATCLRLGIAVRLDPDGSRWVGQSSMGGREPSLWPELVMAIEAHLPAITALVAAGWCLKAEVKTTAA